MHRMETQSHKWRVVLVTPPFMSLGVHVGRKRPKGCLPPLGVGYLAGVLRQQGNPVFYIDAMGSGLSVEETVEKVVGYSPDIVGISCMSSRGASTAYGLVSRLRDRLPRVFLVMGGAHVTSFGELALRECPALNAIIPSEGEYIFAELVHALEENRPLHQVPGVILRDERGVIQRNPEAPLPGELDRIPFPDRAIYDKTLYYPLMNLGMNSLEPATSIITSRGCPWNRCRFCFRGGYHDPKYRRRSPENVVDEIESIVRDTGVRQFKFLDDNFCINTKWITRFCDLLDERGLSIRWSVLGRVDTVREVMLDRMAKSGCASVQFGVESGNQRLLDLMDKGITLEQICQAVAWAKKAGLMTMATCILGLPTETPAEADQTIRFACGLNVDFMFFFPYAPLHGTVLAEMARKEGIVYDDVVEDVHFPVFVPYTYESRKQLQQKVRQAYLRYYLRPAYWARQAKLLAQRPYLITNNLYALTYFLSMLRHMVGFSLASGRKAASEPGRGM